jgi:dihydroflavonol-4-reductase
MKVLVTGATGFLGSNLCERLKYEGYNVRALVRNPQKAEQLKKKGFETTIGDLRDFYSLQRAMNGIDIVFNLAAVWRDNLNKKDLFETNVTGTENILRAAFEEGVGGCSLQYRRGSWVCFNGTG